MEFKDILDKLQDNDFDEVMDSYNEWFTPIPLEFFTPNKVYVDDDFKKFIRDMNAKIVDLNFDNKYVIIETKDNHLYEMPRENILNEIVVDFDINKIRDVTNDPDILKKFYVKNLNNIELLKILTPDQKWAIYETVAFDLRKEDIQSLLDSDAYSDLSDEQKDKIADKAAMNFDIENDCSLSYWDNLYNLIDNAKGAVEQETSDSPYKKYYFTFGSDPAYPYGIDEYMVINAKNIHEAQMAFKAVHPNRPDSACLNYAFSYTEEEWKQSDICNKFYNNQPPVEELTATEDFILHGKYEAPNIEIEAEDDDYEY